MNNIAYYILNYNSSIDTINFIKSINYVKYLFVLDNSNIDKYRIEIFEYLSNNNYQIIEKNNNYLIFNNNLLYIKIYYFNKNFGFAYGVNLLLNETKEYLINLYVIINNDMTVNNNFENSLLILNNLKNKCIYSPVIIDDKSKVWYAGGRLSELKLGGVHFKQFNINNFTNELKLKFTKYNTGCCLIFNKEVLNILGINIFNNIFFFSGEDTELNIRLKNLNIKQLLIYNCFIQGKISASSGGGRSKIGLGYETYYRMQIIRFIKTYKKLPAFIVYFNNRLFYTLKYIFILKYKLSIVIIKNYYKSLLNILFNKKE